VAAASQKEPVRVPNANAADLTPERREALLGLTNAQPGQVVAS